MSISYFARRIKVDINKNPIICAIIAVVAICIGTIFICIQSSNVYITKDEAVSYSGEFLRYDSSRNYCGIEFADDSYFNVYAHTETPEFRDMMKSLDEGTKLNILVNPNNGYVVEIITESGEELMNFEQSQQAIDSYDNGYVIFGIILIIIGVSLISYIVYVKLRKKIKKAQKRR